MTTVTSKEKELLNNHETMVDLVEQAQSEYLLDAYGTISAMEEFMEEVGVLSAWEENKGEYLVY